MRLYLSIRGPLPLCVTVVGISFVRDDVTLGWLFLRLRHTAAAAQHVCLYGNAELGRISAG